MILPLDNGKKQKKKYEDPVIEDLVLDITDYASVMKGVQGVRKNATTGPDKKA
jgi:hypothetical protein